MYQPTPGRPAPLAHRPIIEEIDMTAENRPEHDSGITRRFFLRGLTALSVGIMLPMPLMACREAPNGTLVGSGAPSTIGSEDEARLLDWARRLAEEGFASRNVPLGAACVRVGELAVGTPYEGFTLEEYIRAGGSPARTEPLTLSLTRFDCVSLVESCLAIARVVRRGDPTNWESYAAEMERMRYRDGVRIGYASRLHYFSEWLHDNERRGLVRDLGRELGGTEDLRPLRFMSSNPDAYAALAVPEVRAEIVGMERALDGHSRWVVPTERIDIISERIQTGDILAFATSIGGLDVSHAAYAYRGGDSVLRVLHAPLSGGVVEVTTSTLTQYVRAIRRSTGILVSRPLDG